MPGLGEGRTRRTRRSIDKNIPKIVQVNKFEIILNY
jgi:hypothetical protein